MSAKNSPTSWASSCQCFTNAAAPAVRYVNTNEADGSISVAIDPAVIATVATIEIAVESVAVETAAVPPQPRRRSLLSLRSRIFAPTPPESTTCLCGSRLLSDESFRIPLTHNANVSKPSQNSSTRQVQPIDPRMGTTPLFGYCVLTEEFLVLVGGRDSRNHPVDQLRSVDELGERGRVDAEAGRLRELVF
jgi:hypothetical protein